MKLLFICSRNVNTINGGGEQCTNRNYSSFCELLGTDNVQVIDLYSEGEKSLFWFLSRRLCLFLGFYYGLSFKTLHRILKIALSYDYVFIDTSYYGKIAYYLKKKQFKGKTICFFHNVEHKIKLEKKKINPINLLLSAVVYYNEKCACMFADKLAVLNTRDRDELQKIYNRHDHLIIPISLPDTFKPIDKGLTSLPPTFLFIGKNWYANIHGLRWFIKNVLDYVNVKLIIVGNGMDKFKNEFTHPKIELLGFIPELSSLYIEVDYVISPIFIGGGMKVKTCEALMYGKNIIGTKEAFEGYEFDFDKVGAICNNKIEFISAINKHCSVKRPKYNEYSRMIFLEKYSFKATIGKFESLLL